MLQSANESQRVEDLERELSRSPSFDIDVWSDLFLLLFIDLYRSPVFRGLGFERNHPLVVSFFLFAREYDAGGSVAQGELWLFVVVLPSRLFLVFYPLSMQIV